MGLPTGYVVFWTGQLASRRVVYAAHFAAPNGDTTYVGTYATPERATRVAKRAARRHARKAARS